MLLMQKYCIVGIDTWSQQTLLQYSNQLQKERARTENVVESPQEELGRRSHAGGL